jgi:hypothetical protein
MKTTLLLQVVVEDARGRLELWADRGGHDPSGPGGGRNARNAGRSGGRKPRDTRR